MSEVISGGTLFQDLCALLLHRFCRYCLLALFCSLYLNYLGHFLLYLSLLRQANIVLLTLNQICLQESIRCLSIKLFKTYSNVLRCDKLRHHNNHWVFFLTCILKFLNMLHSIPADFVSTLREDHFNFLVYLLKFLSHS